MERELVKIVSNNPAHPRGYYIQFKDCVKPEDVEYIEGHLEEMQGEPGEAIQLDPGDPPAEPIKPTKKKVKRYASK